MTRDRHDGSAALVASHDALATARRAQARLCGELRGRPGVCGVGLTRRGDGYALRVNVVHPGVSVPADVDGVPVEVRTTGRLTAHADRG